MDANISNNSPLTVVTNGVQAFLALKANTSAR